MSNIQIETVVEKLLKLVDEKVRNEKDLTFLIKGDLAAIICAHVEKEWGLNQWIEDEEDYLEVFDNDKLYWLDLSYGEINDEYEYVYYIQEAIYKGKLLQNDVSEELYLDTRHNLSESNRKRILGKVINLTVTDIGSCIDEICSTVDDTEECSCDLIEIVTNLIEDIDELDDRLEEALSRIEILEKENKKLKTFKNEKYYINDKEVSEKEYEDYYIGLKNKISKSSIDEIGKEWREFFLNALKG